MIRANKSEFKTWSVVNGSKLEVAFWYDQTEIKAFYMTLKGAVANIPSVSNNRQMYASTDKLSELLQCIVRNPRNAYFLAKKALYEAKKIRPRIATNPDHAARLKALTVLYEAETKKQRPRLPVSKETPWAFVCFLSSESARTDSHNIPKALCDWMERVGLIENDLYIDLSCWRKKNLGSAELETLELFGASFEDMKGGVWQMKDYAFSLTKRWKLRTMESRQRQDL